MQWGVVLEESIGGGAGRRGVGSGDRMDARLPDRGWSWRWRGLGGDRDGSHDRTLEGEAEQRPVIN